MLNKNHMCDGLLEDVRKKKKNWIKFGQKNKNIIIIILKR
jgi:hypothetical protein